MFLEALANLGNTMQRYIDAAYDQLQYGSDAMDTALFYVQQQGQIYVDVVAHNIQRIASDPDLDNYAYLILNSIDETYVQTDPHSCLYRRDNPDFRVVKDVTGIA